MSEVKIFYSWQSDDHIPNGINRTFIQNALEKVAKEMRRDPSISVEPVIDRDTQGIPGAPNIVDTILQKIDESEIFICDLTIINSGSKFRLAPNPNVLLELGYALKVRGWDRIVMVVNEAFGKAEKLPFDLPWRRAITYTLHKDGDRTAPRTDLEGKLKYSIEAILRQLTIVQHGMTDQNSEAALSKAELLSRQTQFDVKRLDWLNSHKGIDDARLAFEEVYVEIEKLFDRDAEHNKTIGNECLRQPKPNEAMLSLVYRGMMALNLHWRTNYGNSVPDSGLFLDIKTIGERTDRNQKRVYRSDVDMDWNVVWYDEANDTHRYTSKALAARLYDEFLEEISIQSRPKSNER